MSSPQRIVMLLHWEAAYRQRVFLESEFWGNTIRALIGAAASCVHCTPTSCRVHISDMIMRITDRFAWRSFSGQDVRFSGCGNCMDCNPRHIMAFGQGEAFVGHVMGKLSCRGNNDLSKVKVACERLRADCIR